MSSHVTFGWDRLDKFQLFHRSALILKPHLDDFLRHLAEFFVEVGAAHRADDTLESPLIIGVVAVGIIHVEVCQRVERFAFEGAVVRSVERYND